MMKKMKKMKRILAIVLVAAIALSSHVQVLAATNKGMSFSTSYVPGLDKAWNSYQSEESIEDMLSDDSLYAQLIESDMVSSSPVSSMIDKATDDFLDFLQNIITDDFYSELLTIIEESAEYDSEHTDIASVKYSDIGVMDWMKSLSSIQGLWNSIGTVRKLYNLQGDTVQEQVAEFLILLAQFGISAFSVIGWAIPFPWGLLISVLLNLLMYMVQNSDFLDWLFDTDGDNYESEHYKLQFGNNVYKPNIYIYSQETRDVKVTFGSPGLLTTSIPEYGSGWNVTVEENGQLTDEDGQTWEYLFYESITDPSLFQTESGWRIPADTRQETLEGILADLGFNEQEIADFTEFWTEKLVEGADYIMYPQSTETVDQAMPMTVTDEPESVERIWFVFAEDDGSQVEEPVGYELTRGGEDCPYYVIEWGGLFVEE